MDHFPEGYFYIQSRASGKVVDVDGASLKDDATILLWTPKHNSDDRDNQLFYYQDGFLINKHSDKVIDIRGGPIVEGARIIQYSQKVMADAQNQRWGYNKGYLYVLSDPRFVLDVRGLADGARLVLQHKKYALDPANQNQLWDLVPGGKVRAEREVLFETNFE